MFPEWLGRHHDWRSVESGQRSASIHLNSKGHSLKLVNDSVTAHVTCHEVKEVAHGVARVVAHVKADW